MFEVKSVVSKRCIFILFDISFDSILEKYMYKRFS